ncbi:Zinc finger HIT domain-containing protein 3 [Habropoda laboriosa]|uniref:Zinc finger HIT domain-containing protein 3 n=1 Tax=Habropoda laboriosa TaxID=597456 RepID=A0A0L7R190_9HYME|nr:PREDICTED: zinc finger HIT domain-containing protein 3 [Habropoda laboriosa]KOC64607.1 Zinc finger HIT domain-containing protein 3 [Habropoda laboriosa]
MTQICCMCGKAESSYKCPACKETYCSVGCCKEHKASCQPPQLQQNEVPENKKGNVRYEFPTEDTVSTEKLEQLRHNEELKNCLKNPHVQNIMSAILTDNNPTQAIALAMTEPIFVEVADICLKIIEPEVNDALC